MKRELRPSVSALAFACLATSLPAQAAPGDLDPSFSTDGKVITDFFDHDDGSGDVAIQSEGKIVVAGFADATAAPDSGDFALARYNPNGTLDATFGTGGKVTTDFGGTDDIGRAIAIQADGKMVLAGDYAEGTDDAFALARYTTAGKLDPSFGQGGKVVTYFAGSSKPLHCRFILLQDDQKIVLGGDLNNGNTGLDLALARYNPDGSLDLSFGTNGRVITSISYAFDRGFAAILQSSGKIVVGGTSLIFHVDTQTYTEDFLLIRYKTDGTVDKTFGADGTGTTLTEFEDLQVYIVSLAREPDGSIVALGTATPMNPGPDSIDHFALAKYTAAGVLDTAFGNEGKVITAFGSASSDSAAVLLQPDGRIIAAGSVATANGDRDFAFARYQPDGTLDDTFGVDGLLTTAISSGFDSANGLVLQPDGKLVAAGTGGGNLNFAVARYETGLVTTRSLNLSARAGVGTGDDVLIGGFIITGTDPEPVILRALGPSLSLGSTGVLANPVLELHKPDGTIVTNDNWKDSQKADIVATGIPPTNDLESAIVATLEPGPYTAIVRGKNDGRGVALVEIYDLGGVSATQLANLSSRSLVQAGDNVMIGGFIVGGVNDATVVVRGLGPSLGGAGVANTLADPTLQIVNEDGVELAFNENWQDSQKAALIATGLAPTDDLEAAVLLDLPPGGYTAIVRGKAETTGVGEVEIYNLP